MITSIWPPIFDQNQFSRLPSICSDSGAYQYYEKVIFFQKIFQQFANLLIDISVLTHNIKLKRLDTNVS